MVRALRVQLIHEGSTFSEFGSLDNPQKQEGTANGKWDLSNGGSTRTKCDSFLSGFVAASKADCSVYGLHGKFFSFHVRLPNILSSVSVSGFLLTFICNRVSVNTFICILVGCRIAFIYGQVRLSLTLALRKQHTIICVDCVEVWLHCWWSRCVSRSFFDLLVVVVTDLRYRLL